LANPCQKVGNVAVTCRQDKVSVDRQLRKLPNTPTRPSAVNELFLSDQQPQYAESADAESISREPSVVQQLRRFSTYRSGKSVMHGPALLKL
jgi:hypothetical protein